MAIADLLILDSALAHVTFLISVQSPNLKDNCKHLGHIYAAPFIIFIIVAPRWIDEGKIDIRKQFARHSSS